MNIQAMLVGIDEYPGDRKLTSCVKDITDLAVAFNDQGRTDFNIRLWRNDQLKSAVDMDREAVRLFQSSTDVAIFYFSGHGELLNDVPKLLLTDFDQTNSGMEIRRLVEIANKEQGARQRIIILDCCYAGKQAAFFGQNFTSLAEGVSVIASCSGNEKSRAKAGSNSLFTALLIKALEGSAANEEGHISLPSVFQYIDRNMGSGQQRPVFSTNVSRFIPIKRIDPLEAFNELYGRIHAAIEQKHGKSTVQVVYRRHGYLRLLEEWIRKAKDEICFTSSGILDTSDEELGEQQRRIIDASVDFQNRRPGRLHLGIVGVDGRNYVGAVQLRSNVMDVALKFSPRIDQMSYNALICDCRHVVIRLKQSGKGREDYAIAIENVSLAKRLRESFMDIWHDRATTPMYQELSEYFQSDPVHKREIINTMFNKRTSEFTSFMTGLEKSDLKYRIMGERGAKVFRSKEPLSEFAIEALTPGLIGLINLIRNRFEKRSIALEAIQRVMSNIEKGQPIEYSSHALVFIFQYFLANYYKVRHALKELELQGLIDKQYLSVVDLGGGGGASIAALLDHLESRTGAKAPVKLTIVDSSSEQVAIAKEVLSAYSDIEYVIQDAASFLLPKSVKYDLIMSSNFLCEVPPAARPSLLNSISGRLDLSGHFLVVERVESGIYETLMNHERFSLTRYKFANERFELPPGPFEELRDAVNEKNIDYVKKNYTLRYALYAPKPA